MVVKKSIITKDKLDALADKFKLWTGQDKKFTLDEMIACNFTSDSIVEIKNSEDMNSLLTSDNIGKIILYTGETNEQFINNNIYMIVEEE